MSTVTLANKNIKLEVDCTGASLHRAEYLPASTQLLWNGDERSWKYRDVVMFPVIGRWDFFTVDGVKYTTDMGHGVVRNKQFAVSYGQDSITLSVTSDSDTLRQYPFEFALDVTYSLLENGWTVQYKVANCGQKDMPYYLGAHPGFAVTGNDVIEFAPQTLYNFPLDEKGRIAGEKQVLADTTVKVDKQLFKKHATVVIPEPYGDKITLKRGDGINITVRANSSTVAIWSNAQSGDFVCIEPWWGICEVADSPYELSEKPLVNILKTSSDATYTVSYTVEK